MTSFCLIFGSTSSPLVIFPEDRVDTIQVLAVLRIQDEKELLPPVVLSGMSHRHRSEIVLCGGLPLVLRTLMT
jgi:hypothetical protein